MDDTLRTLAGQLLSVPGAPQSLLADYFSGTSAVDPPPSMPDIVECWKLPDEALLALAHTAGSTKLKLMRSTRSSAVLELKLAPDLLKAASLSGDDVEGPYQVSPVALALTAIAAGFIEGDREIKRATTNLYKQAQSLLLIAACRLCG